MSIVKHRLALVCVTAYLSLAGRPHALAQTSPPGAAVTQVTAAGRHTCVLTTGGGVKCWGYNEGGQLGDGTTTDRTTPVAVSGLTSGVAKISAGESHTCALTTGGGVKCWGYNPLGQLGDGTQTERDTPVDALGLTSGVTSITAGRAHTCALTTGGGVKCWGYNESGQLGDGTTTDRTTPVDALGLTSDVVSIAAGGHHTCALTGAGGVRCWGEGKGQVGDGTSTQRSLAVDVLGLTSGVASIAAGWNHACALTKRGGVKCWGANLFAELGDGTRSQRTTAVDVSGLTSGVASIAAGPSHTCALTAAGGLKCWGQNDKGQLGDGTTTDRTTAVDVSGLGGGVKGIAAGESHTCALTTGGGLKCWGGNDKGQLGDGTTTQRTTPVNVSGLAASRPTGR
jgi:alpha-tubulin suppressor-like RCC1 family protein